MFGAPQWESIPTQAECEDLIDEVSVAEFLPSLGEASFSKTSFDETVIAPNSVKYIDPEAVLLLRDEAFIERFLGPFKRSHPLETPVLM